MGKRKIKRRTPTTSKATPLSSDAANLYKNANRFQTMSMFLSAFSLVLIYISPTVRQSIINIPMWIYIPYVGGWLVLAMLNSNNLHSVRELEAQYKTNSIEYMSLLKAKIIISGVASGLCLLAYFYFSGGHYLIQSAFVKFLPQASSQLLSAFSSLVGFAISGIVGGVAYKHYENIRKRIITKRNK
jgi:hypothetical protein